MNLKKIFLFSAAAIITAGTIGTMPVHAAAVDDTDTGKTEVTYNNENGATGDSGVWMVTFPASIQFEDKDGDTKNLKLALVGNNGYTLDDLNPDLQVHVSATSDNDYTMVDGANSVAYSVKYPTLNVTTETGTADATKVATLKPTAAESVETAVATLGERPTEKGSYKDVITYSISHEGAELK